VSLPTAAAASVTVIVPLLLRPVCRVRVARATASTF